MLSRFLSLHLPFCIMSLFLQSLHVDFSRLQLPPESVVVDMGGAALSTVVLQLTPPTP